MSVPLCPLMQAAYIPFIPVKKNKMVSLENKNFQVHVAEKVSGANNTPFGNKLSHRG